MTAWRNRIRSLQCHCCIICGEPAFEDGSWDHFVPQVYSPRGHRSLRIGLAYWAHQRCNSERGHSLPTPDMVRRAVSIVKALDPDERREAVGNIVSALRVHHGFVLMLDRMSAAITRHLVEQDAIEDRPVVAEGCQA